MPGEISRERPEIEQQIFHCFSTSFDYSSAWQMQKQKTRLLFDRISRTKELMAIQDRPPPKHKVTKRTDGVGTTRSRKRMMLAIRPLHLLRLGSSSAFAKRNNKIQLNVRRDTFVPQSPHNFKSTPYRRSQLAYSTYDPGVVIV